MTRVFRASHDIRIDQQRDEGSHLHPEGGQAPEKHQVGRGERESAANDHEQCLCHLAMRYCVVTRGGAAHASVSSWLMQDRDIRRQRQSAANQDCREVQIQ